MSDLGISILDRIRKLHLLQYEKLPRLSEAVTHLNSVSALVDSLRTQFAQYAKYVEASQDIEEEYKVLMDIKRDLVRVSDQRKDTEAKFVEVQAIALLEQKALGFYSNLLDNLTKEYVSKLQDALNDVYGFVFQRPNKSIQLDLDDRYNKKVLTLKVINLFDGQAIVEDLKASGFSLRVVMGTVLLVYFILYNNLERVIFFDESFGGLADDTLSRFFSLLHVFVDELGFRFLLISHEPRHVDYVDHVYSVRGGIFVKEDTEVTT